MTPNTKKMGDFCWHCSKHFLFFFMCLCKLLTHSKNTVPGARTVFNEGRGMTSKSCNPIYACRSLHSTKAKDVQIKTYTSASRSEQINFLLSVSTLFNLTVHVLYLTEKDMCILSNVKPVQLSIKITFICAYY